MRDEKKLRVMFVAKRTRHTYRLYVVWWFKVISTKSNIQRMILSLFLLVLLFLFRKSLLLLIFYSIKSVHCCLVVSVCKQVNIEKKNYDTKSLWCFYIYFNEIASNSNRWQQNVDVLIRSVCVGDETLHRAHCILLAHHFIHMYLPWTMTKKSRLIFLFTHAMLCYSCEVNASRTNAFQCYLFIPN